MEVVKDMFDTAVIALVTAVVGFSLIKIGESSAPTLMPLLIVATNRLTAILKLFSVRCSRGNAHLKIFLFGKSPWHSFGRMDLSQ